MFFFDFPSPESSSGGKLKPLKHLESILEALEAILRALGGPLERLGGILSALGAILAENVAWTCIAQEPVRRQAVG